ncbi:MAG: gliding motility-associated C-terminal domain-containing protein [Flavobacteriales bacterium]
MRLKIVLLFLLMSCAVMAQFIPNKGQWPGQVLYRSELAGGAMFFEEDRLTYNFIHPKDAEKMHGHAARIAENDSVVRYHAFQMIFKNSNEGCLKESIGASEDKYNYFLGNDPKKWASNLSSYQKVKYNNIYQGVDFLFYKSEVGPKYDFIVHPGANVSAIKLKYEGAEKVHLENNELKIKLSFTELIEQIPLAYQEIDGRQVRVRCSYAIENGDVVFKVGDYDKSKILVIDPVLIFSTYSGATSDNFGYTATYDDDGFLYAGSSALGAGYPTTIGAYDISFNSNPAGGVDLVYDAFYGWINAGYVNTDIAITKYDTSGTKRIYSTFLGGELCEVPHSLVVNSKGELVIYGTTGSKKFPVTSSAYDTTFAGGAKANLSRGIDVNYVNGSDIILSVLSTDGSTLVGSTFFGGVGNDGLNLRLNYNYADQMRGEVICDQNDNVIVVSNTYSSGLATAGVFQNNLSGLVDGIVAKFSPHLQNLTWASYLGGSVREAVYSVVIDNSGDLVVAGGTTSSDLATTAGVVYPTYQGDPSDGFIGKISNDGTTLKTLTYFGTSVYDQVYFVKVDKADNIFVYGQSASMDSSLIKNAAYYSVKSGMFVTKLTNDLKTIVWSTTFGSGTGEINLSPTAFMVDLCSKVYLSGWGSSGWGFELIPNYLYDPSGFTGHNGGRGTTGLPVTSDAFQKTTDGNDFYIMVLEDDASAISYASFFGGNLSEEHVDGGTSRFDRKGKIYQSMCAGCGANSDMPIYPANAVSPTNNSNNCNNGVFKMDFLIPNVIADFKSITECVSENIQFKNTSLLQQNTSFFWDFGDGDTSTAFQPNHTYSSPGTYFVKLKLSDPSACNLADSVVKQVKILELPSIVLHDTAVCTSINVQLGISPLADATITYRWSPGTLVSDSMISNPITSLSTSQQFSLEINNGYCKDTLHQTISISDVDYVLPLSQFCNQLDSNISLTIHSSKGKINSYLWATNSSMLPQLNSNVNDSTFQYISKNGTTKLYLQLTDTLGCIYSDSLSLIKSQPKQERNQALCPAISTPIGYTPYRGNGNVYDWTPGEWLSDSTISNPIASPTQSINYVLLIDVGGVCKDTLVEKFVIPDISINAKGDTVYCNTSLSNSDAWVDVLKGKANQFIWSTNSAISDTLNSDLSSSQISLPILNGINKFYVQELDSTGCLVLDSVYILKDVLGVDLPSKQMFCQEDDLWATATALPMSDSLTYHWWDSNHAFSFPDSSSVALQNVPGITKMFVEVTDTANCTAKDSMEVYISALTQSSIKAWADKDTILKGNSTFVHVSPSNYNYLWTPFSTLNESTMPSMLVSPIVTTQYKVNVIDTADALCSYKTDVTVYVYDVKCDENDVYVPNIFTPNGDGKNDMLYVRGNNIVELYFTIYDRWGEKVFETTDQKIGWDGVFKGMSSDPAVFVYYLTVKCPGDKEFFTKGNITVIR